MMMTMKSSGALGCASVVALSLLVTVLAVVSTTSKVDAHDFSSVVGSTKVGILGTGICPGPEFWEKNKCRLRHPEDCCIGRTCGLSSRCCSGFGEECRTVEDCCRIPKVSTRPGGTLNFNGPSYQCRQGRCCSGFSHACRTSSDCCPNGPYSGDPNADPNKQMECYGYGGPGKPGFCRYS